MRRKEAIRILRTLYEAQEALIMEGEESARARAVRTTLDAVRDRMIHALYGRLRYDVAESRQNPIKMTRTEAWTLARFGIIPTQED